MQKLNLTPQTKRQILIFLANSLIKNGMPRCIYALNMGKTAKDIEQTLTFIEKCTIQLGMRHGELYIAPQWRIPWNVLTKREIMATKLLFSDKGTHIYSKFHTGIANSYFNKHEYAAHIMLQLGQSLRVATQTLHQNKTRWKRYAERTEGRVH